MLLTIAIPTYNRNDILLRSILKLLPQMTDECQLLVIDNASPIPVSDTLGPLLLATPSVKSAIVRNKVNVGGSANVLRCIELCETDWLWILGDDDEVSLDAIELALNSAKFCSDAIFINFSSEIYHRKETFITTGLDGFIKGFESFSNTLLISSGLYNAQKIVPQLRFGYAYGYSMAPHFAMLLMSLDDTSLCYFVNAQIIHWQPQTNQQQWSFINAALGFMTLLELPLNAEQRVILSRKISASLPRLEYIVNQLIGLLIAGEQKENVLYLYDNITQRVYYHKNGLNIKRYVYRLILTQPRISQTLLKIYSILRKRSTSLYIDRFSRV